MIQEFDKNYKAMCNQQYQRKKNRNVSPESPFDKNNIPPKQYLQYDYQIPKNPTKQNPKEIDISNIQLAGRLTEVGQKIIAFGSKKAPYITTMNWGVGHESETDRLNKSAENDNSETINQTYGKFIMTSANFKSVSQNKHQTLPKISLMPNLKQ